MTTTQEPLANTTENPFPTPYSKVYPESSLRLYQAFKTKVPKLPLRNEYTGCCGLDNIYGLVAQLCYGVGKKRYDPIATNTIEWRNGVRLSAAMGKLYTQEKIDREKKETLDQLALFAKDHKSKAGTVIAITHAQFIIIGKELYDLGYVALINNSISHGHNNRIIFLFKENPHDENEHETHRGFTFEEVMETIDKYKLR